jgi:hypothetical protein
MATVLLRCLKPLNRSVPWCFSEKSNCVYTSPTKPRPGAFLFFSTQYNTGYIRVSADANPVYSRLIPRRLPLHTSNPTITDFTTVELRVMPVLSRERPGNEPKLPCSSLLKLELRESDVSPCEQYSLREMARTKMKYEN